MATLVAQLSSYLFIFITVAIVSNVSPLRCYLCNNLKQTHQMPCPGRQLLDFPGAEACRLLARKDGTIINQSPVARQLCTATSLASSKLKIAKDYLDGNGITACCMWDGCNSDAVKATKTKDQYETYLLAQVQEAERLRNPLVNRFESKYDVSTQKMGFDFMADVVGQGVVARGEHGWQYDDEELASEDTKGSSVQKRKQSNSNIKNNNGWSDKKSSVDIQLLLGRYPDKDLYREEQLQSRSSPFQNGALQPLESLHQPDKSVACSIKLDHFLTWTINILPFWRLYY